MTEMSNRSNTDLEKGNYDTSDFEAATIVPDSERCTTSGKDGPLGGSNAGEQINDEYEHRDPNIVDWDGPDDPQNPQNWPMKKRWGNVAVLSLLTILTYVSWILASHRVPVLTANTDMYH